jgi:hypothetical protein
MGYLAVQPDSQSQQRSQYERQQQVDFTVDARSGSGFWAVLPSLPGSAKNSSSATRFRAGHIAGSNRAPLVGRTWQMGRIGFGGPQNAVTAGSWSRPDRDLILLNGFKGEGKAGRNIGDGAVADSVAPHQIHYSNKIGSEFHPWPPVQEIQPQCQEGKEAQHAEELRNVLLEEHDNGADGQESPNNQADCSSESGAKGQSLIHHSILLAHNGESFSKGYRQ